MDDAVDVLSTASSISVGSLDLNDTLTDFQNGDIECSSSEVIDSDGFVFLLLHSESHGCCCGFVDDSFYLESSDLAGVFGGLTLRVIEISGDSDDSAVDCLSEIALGSLLHLHEDEGSDL